MTDPEAEQPAGPYAATAAAYLRHGWAPLPIPYGQKKPVPDGWTGNDGAWPSFADVHAWVEERGGSNVGLRLPPNVLGIDVDSYGAKPGGAVFAALQEQHGTLPATWRVTSRDDGQSGIRFYRVPEGLRWPGVLGPGIETIRYAHRYAVAWPSIHPDTQKPYRWITPDGAVSLADIPDVANLPALPDAWVQALTLGELATDQPKASLSEEQADTWLRERSGGAPCRVMEKVLKQGLLDLHGGGSRHDAALSLTNKLAWLAGEGHGGVIPALALAELDFHRAKPEHEPGEWQRMVAGAVRMSAAAHPRVNPDPCDDPFAGLISKEQQWTTSTTSQLRSSTSLPGLPTGTKSGATPTAAAAGSAPVVADTPSDTAERTSWWPRNLDRILDGTHDEETPSHLARSDGHRFFYAGRVNGIIGPSESGKSWLALQAVVEAVHEEQQATFLDFEDSDSGVIRRLEMLGLTPAQIRRFVAYINPDEAYSRLSPSGADLVEHLMEWEPELIILDGVNAAMTLQGLDLISNKDATTFAQHILKPLAGTGACVVYVDHTPKSKDNTAAGGIGAQAKRAMTTGCTLKIDPIKQFGKGQDGKLRAYVDKDRVGAVRGVSLPSNGTHWAADILVTPGAGGLRLAVNAPEGYDASSGSYEFRPTVLMERVSTWLAQNAGAGRNEILRSVTGDPTALKKALRLLVSEGWVRVDERGQKHPHFVVSPFNELSTVTGVTGVEPGLPTPGWPGLPGLIPATPEPRLVKRAVAGREVLVDLKSGAIVEEGEAGA